MNMTTPPDLDGQPLELLIKLMAMTKAEDTIALVAIKKANAHLSKLGTDWEALLRGKVKIIADPFASINIPQAAMNPNRNQDYKPQPPRAPQRPTPRPTPPPPAAPQRASNPPPHPRPQPKPAPGSPAFTGDTKERSIVNKFDGTCTKCKSRVLAGDGIAHQWKRPSGTTYWTSEHSPGCCPTTQRRKPVTTSDDFQI